MQKIRDEEINAPAELPRPKYRINQSLTLADLSMVFVVQSIGLLLGVLAFLGEYTYSRNNKKGKSATSVWVSVRYRSGGYYRGSRLAMPHYTSLLQRRVPGDNKHERLTGSPV